MKTRTTAGPGRRRTALFIFCSIIIGAALCLFPGEEDVTFESLSIRQGLSQSTVNCMLQDRKGFMWFGTSDGLNKYDGYEFTVYTFEPGNPNSLSNNIVTALCEGPGGELWIGTNGGGLNRFEPASGRFERFRRNPANSNSIGGDIVRALLADSRGVLWIGTEDGGLDRFEPGNGGRFVHYRKNPEQPFYSVCHNDIRCIAEDSPGVLWIGTNGGGLSRFDIESGRFEHFNHDPETPGSISHNSIGCIYNDSAGGTWVGTRGGGLNRFDREKGIFTHYKISQNKTNQAGSNGISGNDVTAIIEDSGGVLWIGTRDGGLNRMDKATGTFTYFRAGRGQPGALSSDKINALYEDRTGMLWIGTFDRGLNTFDGTKKKFAGYSNQENNPNSLGGSVVWAIREDRGGNLWIGMEGAGLDKFNRSNNTYTHYRHEPGNPAGPGHASVRVIHEDPSGVLWLGTDGGGLDRFDPGTGEFRHYPHDPQNLDSPGHGCIRAIYQDTSGNLWLGTYGGGLDRFDPVTGSYDHYRHVKASSRGLSDDRVWTVIEDSDGTGTLWIGTDDGGVNRMDPRAGTFKHYRSTAAEPVFLSNNRVLCIHQGRDGVLWFGTQGGLDRFDKKDEKITRYRLEQGLPSNVIYGILEQEGGLLWLSTNKGLVRFDPGKKTFIHYDETNGLQYLEFSAGAYYRSKKGEMFFGGGDGFNSFFPRTSGEKLYVPAIVFTRLAVFNRPVAIGEQANGRVILEKSITGAESLELLEKENLFSLMVAALDYRSPRNNWYTYKLEGRDEAWQHLGRNREITFPNLEPGRYTLRVKGGGDGAWNEEGAAIRISVKPSFWSPDNLYPGLFYLFCLLTFFSVLKPALGLYRKFKHRYGYLARNVFYLLTFYGWCLVLTTSDYIFRLPGEKTVFAVLLSFPWLCLLVYLFITIIRGITGEGPPRGFYLLYWAYCFLLFMGLLVSGAGVKTPAGEGLLPLLLVLHLPVMAVPPVYTAVRVLKSEYFSTLPYKRTREALKTVLYMNVARFVLLGAAVAVNLPFSYRYFIPFLVFPVGPVFFVFFRGFLYSIDADVQGAGAGESTASTTPLFHKYGFSPREQEITCLVVEGKTNKEIANQLFLSFYTVRNHLFKVFKKVGVKNRVELARMFQESREEEARAQEPGGDELSRLVWFWRTQK